MKKRQANPASIRPAKSGGFTLIESLVATSILILLFVLLGNVLISTTRISAQATSRLNAARLGREVFELIGRDLSQVVSSRSSLSTKAPLQFWVNPPQLDNSQQNATAIFWQSSVARDRNLGSVAVVGYFVQNSGTRPQLRRVLIEPKDPLYKIYSDSANWLPASSIAAFGAPSGGSGQPDRGWVADGVLGLWVRCLDSNGNVISTDGAGNARGYKFDSQKGYQSGSGADKIVYGTFNALPAFVEVGMVCIAPNDVDQIKNLPSAAAVSPANFETEMAAFLSTFNQANPRVKSGTSVTRRFRLYGAYQG